jgi:hypothetical protein
VDAAKGEEESAQAKATNSEIAPTKSSFKMILAAPINAEKHAIV